MRGVRDGAHSNVSMTIMVRRRKDMEAIKGRKPVAKSRPRYQIPKRHRGHRNAGSPRRLIDLVTQSPA
jgi:hypothetical protein